MQLFRLTRARHAGDLSGRGSKLHPGRWNPAGMPVIYASTSRPLALLEVMVHVRRSDFPVDLTWSVLEIPPEWWETAADFDGRVPDDVSMSRRFGSAWHAARAEPMLKVPSAIFPDRTSPSNCEWNAVLNAEHPEVRAQLRCVDVQPFALDPQLHRLG
jgi:RES domain-containing protein